ncbi:ribulose-phosphate 3-epimerase [Moniliophthora roreri]|nr:ribulose-phosphate 3-epimerase [Moniliophthora roreri]
MKPVCAILHHTFAFSGQLAKVACEDRWRHDSLRHDKMKEKDTIADKTCLALPLLEAGFTRNHQSDNFRVMTKGVAVPVETTPIDCYLSKRNSPHTAREATFATISLPTMFQVWILAMLIGLLVRL